MNKNINTNTNLKITWRNPFYLPSIGFVGYIMIDSFHLGKNIVGCLRILHKVMYLHIHTKKYEHIMDRSKDFFFF